MKKEKAKHRRRDNFNWKKISHFDKWCMDHAPVKMDHSERRCAERSNIRKLMKGYDPDFLEWPSKWQRFKDYYF